MSKWFYDEIPLSLRNNFRPYKYTGKIFKNK